MTDDHTLIRLLQERLRERTSQRDEARYEIEHWKRAYRLRDLAATQCQQQLEERLIELKRMSERLDALENSRVGY